MARGTIDQLNFEVILNDSKFDAQVKKDIALANQLNTSLTNSLNLRKKLVVEERAYATAAAKAATAQQKAQAAIEKQAKGLTASGVSLNRAWLRFSATLWSIISIVRLFTRTIGQAIKNISDFQQANANLATIMQVSKREIEVLTNDALMLGRTTEWTASQVTELQTALAKLGYNIPQIRNMQESVLQFATAVGAKLPDAANLAGASLRMFGMHSSETQKALEILTASTNKTALDFEKLKIALPYVGAIAHSIGFDVADTAAMLGVLANSGLAASRTGTGLRKVLLELSKENGKLQTAMGGNIKNFNDFVDGLQRLRDRGLEAGEAQKLVGDRAGAALLILANGVDDIRRLNDEVRDTDGLLKSIQAERLDTLHGSTLLLKSAWEGLIQTFRDSAGPMKDVVDWLTKIIRATSLAASRTNRVAQGTKNNWWERGTSGITGSDTLTKQFKEHFDSLIKNGTSPEDAAKVVSQEMQSWLDGAMNSLIDAQHHGYKENVWNRALYNSYFGRVFVGGKMNRGREANEQIEAIENAIDAVNAYMINQAKEGAEVAANEYLEEWKLVFDTQGEAAARAAMKAVPGFDEIKSRMEAYMANGGETGASERGRGKDETRQLSLEQKAWIAMLEETEDWLEKDFNKQLDKNTKDFEKGVARREKAAEDYDKLFKEWSAKDFSKQGEGAMFSVSSALADYNTKNNEVDLKYAKGLSLLQEKHKGNAEAIEKEAQALRNLRDAEKDANLAAYQEKIRDLAGEIFKEGMEGFDLTNWDEKSLSQIIEIAKAVKNLKVPDDIKNLLDKDTLGILEKALSAVADKFMKRTLSPEEQKKFAKNIKLAANHVLDLAESFGELGEAMGNANMKQAADSISALGEFAKSASQGFAQGGVFGAVIGALASIGKTILAEITEEQKESARIAQAMKDAAVAYEEAVDALAVASQESIFGVNGMGRFREYVRIMEKYRKALSDYYATLREEGGVGDYIISNYSDGQGNFDLEKLKADIEAGLITGADDIARAIERYKESLKEVDGVIESVFGDIASSAADQIVDSWIEAGNAALDYADILDDVAKAYSKMLIQSVIMETALDPITDDLKRAFTENRYEDAMAMVANAMQTIEAAAPVYEQILRAFDPYFNRSESTSGGGGLSSGIKGITEETANLLASYINAIRADVSFIRVMQERGLEHINAFGASLPTLNDYIAQIAATNFDIAQSNQRILSELQSVIGAPGTSGMVVRVEAS